MAAGLGFKTFTTGEVLTAADTNGYLMQGINVFASTAARDAAITSPQEGQFAFTKDTNGLWYYDGAAWVASGATGDIEGVTAGIGISGGGTSGTVTVTNSMATAIDAKGDLIGGTGADTFARLAVGANDTVLTADSTAATGLKWATASSGGITVIASGSIGANATVTFSSISGTYKNLQLNVNGWSTTPAGRTLTMFVNTAGTGYGSVYQTYGGTGNQRSNSANQYVPIGTGIYPGASGNTVILLPNYAATTNQKQGTYIEFDDDGSGAIAPAMGTWGKTATAAISSITIGLNGTQNFSAGTYELLGIK